MNGYAGALVGIGVLVMLGMVVSDAVRCTVLATVGALLLAALIMGLSFGLVWLVANAVGAW